MHLYLGRQLNQALLHSDKEWCKVERTFSVDTQKIADYSSAWRLKLSMAKTFTTAFHLNNWEAMWQLAIYLNGSRLLHSSTPKYLDVKCDCQLTYKQHIQDFWRKITTRNNLLRCLAGTTWGANTSTLCTSALAITYSAAEYAAPMWCRSTHTKKLDIVLYDTMWIITGCLWPLPISFLPVLSGITPPTQCREHIMDKLVWQARMDSDHPLHNLTLDEYQHSHPHVVSRCPFPRHAAKVFNSGLILYLCGILNGAKSCIQSSLPSPQTPPLHLDSTLHHSLSECSKARSSV